MSGVGQSLPHESAEGHATGRASFIDDIPRRQDELLVGLVTSPVACARLVRVESTAARAIPGVIAILTAQDIPGATHFGPLVQDEPILALDTVRYIGQPVAIIAAESATALQAARAMVQLEFDTIAPPVLSIEEAIAANRFLTEPHVIARGNVEAALAKAPIVRRGVFQCLGQEHLYFETQAAVAMPGDDGQIQLHVSTQGPSETQHVVAETLGKPLNHVICTTRRLGGGFGGKETQANLTAACAALVTQHTGRAARLVYERGEDMRNTGKRHPFRVEWEAGVDASGRIQGLRVLLFSDGGAYTDLSPSVMDRAMLHIDNAYFLEHVYIEGRVCETHHAPATAFRGFGGPQGIATMETIVQELTLALREIPNAPRHALALQQQNLYGRGERNSTPYGQIVAENHLPEIMSMLVQESDFDTRFDAIEAHNRTDSRWLRGMAVSPVKFGISFVATFMNQANAQVLVYPDGSVQVSTGGTEMGQGLNTKIRQLVSGVFGIDPAAIAMMATSTDKNHNTSPTAASASTDLNGAAAVQAATTVRDRLARWALQQWAPGTDAPTSRVSFAHGLLFDHEYPERRIPFADACAAARFARVDLGARGFYATPGLHFDRSTGRGAPFLYYTQGAAVAEVCIDRFTGMVRVPRVDLRIDIGQSINPGIDRGQIIGGFVQGLGWVTTECLMYDPNGAVLTDSFCTYKVPLASDVPPHFSCHFHETDGPAHTVARSKAVGEPPLMLAVSVFSAVRHALGCVSPAAAQRLCLPATPEEVLRALSLAHVPFSHDDAMRWQHSASIWQGTSA
ncbi:xanthine dehydrogenase molybdopterin binding subunit [Gemmatimonas phototrophica]|uniref:xanthine dehydrogenase molybdopterin binding subunit n=1 Tax=Gemmatimonas phototrophica TaxID=1379270 RepID=UPI0006A6B7BB|nr:molybdopterin cofactor-binding domain-containing protein [Gemmatimonas phototrophica]